MIKQLSGHVSIPSDKLWNVAETLLRAMGSDAAEAREVADHLVRSNLKGHDSHGVGMLPIYAANAKAGKLRPNQHAKRTGGEGQFGVFDGNMGYGQVVCREVMDWAIETARTNGAAFAGLGNVHHIGRVGTYGEHALRANMISISFVSALTGPPFVAPFRGTDGRMSTNPICIAIPSANAEEPFVLDFATSKVAMGKVRVAGQEGRQMEPGLLIDKQGNPTTDPGVLWPDKSKGAILPIGEHKGYGLAVVCELLAGAMIGSGTYQPENDFNRGIVNSIFSIVFDPTRLTSMPAFQMEMQKYVEFVKASPPRDPAEPVLVAGEPERISEKKRRVEGVPVDKKTWSDILDSAVLFGLPKAELENLAGVS